VNNQLTDGGKGTECLGGDSESVDVRRDGALYKYDITFTVWSDTNFYLFTPHFLMFSDKRRRL
jgi:hypothetical protein